MGVLPPRVRALLVLVSIVAASALTFSQAASSPTADVYRSMRWRYIGPEGNRVSAVNDLSAMNRARPDSPYIGREGRWPIALTRRRVQARM